MEAFGSWVRLGGGAGMDGAMLCQHPLVLAALAGLEVNNKSSYIKPFLIHELWLILCNIP
jgi:hypothetical protein